MLARVTSSAYAICRDARMRAGISQRALAARAGVSASTVARIERGRMEPTFELLTRLIEACGCELRIRVTEIDWSGRNALEEISFEDRLHELHALTRFELELADA
jgi:transcriptional regulator with XRE-family HTH domain